MTQTASLYSSDAFLLCKTSYVIKEKKNHIMTNLVIYIENENF